jgi:HNH endonuclease
MASAIRAPIKASVELWTMRLASSAGNTSSGTEPLYPVCQSRRRSWPLPMSSPKPLTPAEAKERERFDERVCPEPMSGCWLWTGTVLDNGYAVLWNHDKWRTVPAHRISYERYRGPIPDGLTLDHLCRVKCCVNPSHLEPVTNRVNILRGVGPTAMYARRTQCDRGHQIPDEKGSRQCRKCKTIYQRAFRARLRGES